MKRTRKMSKVLLGCSVAFLFIFVVVSHAAAQTWTQLAPTGGPPVVRTFHTAVYNPSTNRMTVFGGMNGTIFSGVHPKLNDLWVLTNADGLGGTPAWTQLSPTGGPPVVRGGHSAVYDPATNRMTVFAGNPNISFCGGTVNDLWVLTNADGLGGTPAWTQLSPTGGPPSKRWNHSAVYDPATNRMIVFGGGPACPTPSNNNTNQVWVLTNVNGLGGTPNWILLSPTGGPPPISAGHVAVYDLATNRMTVFNGNLGIDVWVLENANGLGGTPNWTQLSPTGGPPSTLGGHGVYNPTTNQMTVFGGFIIGIGTSSNEVWVLENANGLGGTPNWTLLSPTGVLVPARQAHSAVFNVASDRMTVFGGASNVGVSSGVAFNDTWVLSNPTSASVPLDHFKCYETEDETPGFVPIIVTLSDQFETKDTTVKKPKLFCNPVDKEGEGIINPADHLTCYKIKDVEGQPKFEERDVLIDNQFGELVLEVEEPELLCVPSEKNGVSSALNLDHFKCYEAEDETPGFMPLDVLLSDQFETKDTTVKKPKFVCNPVDKSGEGIINSADHLTCYKIKDVEGQPKFEERVVLIDNQFGALTLNIEKPKMLCVPSTKIDLGPSVGD